MQEILQLEQVCYSYDEHTDALTDCTVGIGAGERIAVLGSNGAGKSTFFLLANGVLTPKRGKILLDGQPVGASGKSPYSTDSASSGGSSVTVPGVTGLSMALHMAVYRLHKTE